jgi:hypothetical protein
MKVVRRKNPTLFCLIPSVVQLLVRSQHLSPSFPESLIRGAFLSSPDIKNFPLKTFDYVRSKSKVGFSSLPKVGLGSSSFGCNLGEGVRISPTYLQSTSFVR